MNLHRCGGPNDQGIDIQVEFVELLYIDQGEWDLDSLKVPILVQCKNTKVTRPQFVLFLLSL